MKLVEKKHRRFLAAMLTLCLLLGLCPLTPSAQAEETTTTVVGSTTIEDAQSVPVGESVTTTLVAGKNYYAIPDVKAWQQISVELDKAYNSTRLSFYYPDGRYWQGGGNGYQLSKMAYTDGKYYFAVEVSQPMTLSFTVTLYDNDGYEPNNTIDTATPIQPEESVNITLLRDDCDFFAITTTKPYQYIVLQTLADSDIYAALYDNVGGLLQSSNMGMGYYGGRYAFCAAEEGTYYLKLSSNYGRISFSFSVTLLDNDANEPNDTKAAATPLHDGESTEFTVAGSDVDCFKVTTTAPGQDIALTVSGYNYANRNERFTLYFDPAEKLDTRTCTAYAYVNANETFYFHAVEAGEHYIALRNDTAPISCTRNLSVQILDGDQNEPNDTKENATPLTVGTDKEFMVGGFGDEDWFWFEAAPDAGEKKLYTLSFIGLNTDYSDMFYYDIYAKDGTAVTTGTPVNIRHVNTFSCDQQGQYKVRIYTSAGLSGSNSQNYYKYSVDYPRSALRICVSEGGDDPYESNDTWLTAANVPVGNIQHVLSSTTDADWFCFTVPENDMTLHLTSTKQTTAMLYRAETLMESDENSSWSEFSKADKNSRGAISFTDTYFKLTDAGLYYIKLTAGSSYVSTDIRTTGIQLLPATDEENNDTWKKATPLYEGVPQSFTLSADNDVDWFKIIVPEDGTRLYFTSKGAGYRLYREKDFIEKGDNAIAIKWWGDSSSETNSRTVDLNLDKGTYYLSAAANERMTDCSVTYRILPVRGNNHSLETAKSINAGEWVEFYYDSEYDDDYSGSTCDYFCIGECKAGEIVRVSRDGAGERSFYYLLDSTGTEISYDYTANRTFSIPADGTYYLRAYARLIQDENGRWRPFRLRYDIGSEGEVTSIESVDPITMIEGETVFLDLRCAPYTTKSPDHGTSNDTFYIYTPSCVSYYNYSGYLTARSAGTGALTVGLRVGDALVEKEIPVTVLAKDSLSASDVSISGAPETLSLGASADLTANYTLAGGAVLTNPQKAVTWTSSDPKVLYVSPGGKVTAVGGGTATITATVGGTSATTDPITVTAEEQPTDTVTSLTLDKYSLTLYMNEEGEQLTATVQPASFTGKIVWKSSNTDVASVSGNGLVTAVGPGTCIISATAGGRHVSATVSVLAERVRVSGVSFAESKHEIPMGGTATLTATITPADATVKTLVWTSDDPGIASVSRTGIVTAVSVGTTKIRATSVDGNHSAEVTVTVTAAPQLGDVNGDGYIDSADAMLCLRSAVGLKKLTEEQKSAADVNKDGFVDAGDAIKILRYDAKLIDSLN